MRAEEWEKGALLKASDIMIKEFDAVLPSSTIKDAVNLLKSAIRGKNKKGVNALMVIDVNGKLVGMITMSRIMRAIIPFYMEMAHLSEFAWEGLFEQMCRKVQDKTVSELMERNVLSVGADANLMEISDTMLKHGYRRLPVLENGKVIGIVYRKEVFFKIVDAMLEKEGLN